MGTTKASEFGHVRLKIVYFAIFQLALIHNAESYSIETVGEVLPHLFLGDVQYILILII